MTILQLNQLAKSIVEKGQEVNEDTLQIESLFFPYGTLSKSEANQMLWAKREDIQRKVDRKHPDKEGFALCPASLEFNYWSNYGNTRKILDRND